MPQDVGAVNMDQPIVAQIDSKGSRNKIKPLNLILEFQKEAL